MIQIQISEDALQDLNDGFLFYETQAVGLGDYFASCLKADIEGLKVSAGVHRIVYADYHWLRVFPYGVFYTFEQDVAVVWAIIDLRRDPAWIREHLKD